MCIIIDKPEGQHVPDAIIEEGMIDNPDGWGIMWTEQSTVLTQCGMRYDDFWNAWDQVRDNHATIHFRWATHGSKSLHNCHPFEILKGQYAVVHNGIISIRERKKDRSDTWHYANDVLAPFLAKHPEAFGSEAVAMTMGQHLGTGNKLVILREDGARMFINRDAGVEHNGLWLSNRGPLEPRRKWAAMWDKQYDIVEIPDEELLFESNGRHVPEDTKDEDSDTYWENLRWDMDMPAMRSK